MELDDELRQLLAEEGVKSASSKQELGVVPDRDFQIQADGRPLDPADTMAYDRRVTFELQQNELRLLEAQKEHLALRAADRQAHQSSELLLLEAQTSHLAARQADREDCTRHWREYAAMLALESQARSSQPAVGWQSVSYHLPEQTWYPVAPSKLRRERAWIASMLIAGIFCTVVMITVLAGAFRAQGAADVQRRTQYATSAGH